MPTFQAQIPAKLILFGEWAVLFGHKAIGCSVGKYFNLELLPYEDKGTFSIETPELRYAWKNQEDTVPAFLEKTFSILKSFNPNILETLKGQQLKLFRNWPLSEGLGSSSALYLALYLLNLNFKQNQKNPDIHTIRKSLIDFQGGGSGFDILLQAAGDFLVCELTDIQTQFKRIHLNIPDEIIFVHTGKKMKTDQAIQDLKANQHKLQSSSDEIAKSVDHFINEKDWEKCIREHYHVLNQMNVIPPFIQELRNDWLDKKWIQELKTTGAGGGDTLMLFVNPCKKPELFADLEAKGYWLEEAELGVQGALTTYI